MHALLLAGGSFAHLQHDFLLVLLLLGWCLLLVE